MKQIIVGQYYSHPNYRGTVYLGCGDIINRYSPDKKIKNKRLVIVKATDPSYVGNLVSLKKGKKDEGFFFTEFNTIPKS
jgi:hypothetical protein